MKSWQLVTRSPEQTRALGETLGRLCAAGTAILLEGDLGSGKTCFVQGVAAGLDVPESVAVNSPTYTLMNQYQGRVPIAHFDLYRLGCADELADLDFDSYLFGDGVTIVEWAGLVERRGVEGLAMSLDYGSADDERTFSFTALEQRGADILEQLSRAWAGDELNAE